MTQNKTVKTLLAVFVFIRKYPKVILPIVGFLTLFYFYEIFVARENAVYQGVPQSQSFSLNSFTRVLRNSHFIIGYSDYRGNPLWVSYLLTPIAPDNKGFMRPTRFTEDWRNITHIKHDDYTRSGYDRGHMAPNSAISKLYGREAQLSTFLMTNITPQKANLNRKVWQRLEAIESKEFTAIFDKVWVVTGPIFDEKITRLKSSSYVEIPDAFFKIYIGLKGKEAPKALAFIMPQKVKGNESLMKFLTTIDDVEAKTHLDFFSKLEDNLEEKLESSQDPKAWNLQAVANTPSRY